MTAVRHLIQAKAKDLGDDFFVRRSLPSTKQRMVGPFIFWDHMGPVELSPTKEMKVRAHPHIGLATMTYLFSGEITHRDSLGNEVVIKPGEVNWMTAGSGITHSERSQPKDKPIQLEGIQLWVALPIDAEDVAASFQNFKKEELPTFNCQNYHLSLIAGEYDTYKSPVPVYSDLFYMTGKGQGDFSMTFKEDQQTALYIVRGQSQLEGMTLDPYTLLIVEDGQKLEWTSEGEIEFMIFGGKAFPEPRHIWWNFVSHDKNKIEQAKERWRRGEFPKTINETEFIPLPEN